MNTVSIILAVIIALCAALAIFSIIRTKKKNGCTGNCASCRGCRR